MPGGRKRKRTVAKESHVSDFERTEEDSQLGAKKKPRKATRKLTDELAKNAEDSERCGEMSLTLTPKSVLLLSDDLADTCLLFLERGQNVCIKGSAKVTALAGLAEVMGSILKPGHESVEIFSASTSSLLTLSECSKDSSSSKRNLKRTLQNALQRQPSEVMKKALVRARKAATVLLLKSLQTVEMKFVCSFQSFQDIFSLELGKDASLHSTEMLLKKKTAKLGFIIVEPDATRCGVLKIPDQWKAVGDVVQQAGAQAIQQDAGKAPVVLICGGKDMGKSTFARYLTNLLLNSLKELCFLECDLGQTEFTPPGLISFNKVCSPLLGPPFTHPQQPERSVFFGDVSPKDKPEFYIQCVQYVYQAYADNYKNRIPLVVNTQGWVRGMGVPLMIDVIRLVQPTHIIQFNYAAKEHANKNLPKITSDFLLETPGWTFAIDDEQTLASNHRDGVPSPESDQQNEQERTSRIFLGPVVLQIDTEEPRGDTAVSKFSASDHRTLALLAYFSKTKPDTGLCSPNEGRYSRPMTSILSAVPYDIPWSQVALHVMHTELPWNQILYSVNASVVGLAESSLDQLYQFFLGEDIVDRYLEEAQRGPLLSGIITKLHRREDTDGSPCYLVSNPITECIGLGIIRNIDPVKRVLYVLTPLSLDAVQRVNTLLKGNLEIPAVLLLSSKPVSGPYISNEFSYELRGAGARKVRYNLMRRRNPYL